jgi:hypothetical protein
MMKGSKKSSTDHGALLNELYVTSKSKKLIYELIVVARNQETTRLFLTGGSSPSTLQVGTAQRLHSDEKYSINHGDRGAS